MEITLPRRSPFNVPEVGSRRLNDHFLRVQKVFASEIRPLHLFHWDHQQCSLDHLKPVPLISGLDHMTLPFRQRIIYPDQTPR